MRVDIPAKVLERGDSQKVTTKLNVFYFLFLDCIVCLKKCQN